MIYDDIICTYDNESTTEILFISVNIDYYNQILYFDHIHCIQSTNICSYVIKYYRYNEHIKIVSMNINRYKMAK